MGVRELARCGWRDGAWLGVRMMRLHRDLARSSLVVTGAHGSGLLGRDGGIFFYFWGDYRWRGESVACARGVRRAHACRDETQGTHGDGLLGPVAGFFRNLQWVHRCRGGDAARAWRALAAFRGEERFGFAKENGGWDVI